MYFDVESVVRRFLTIIITVSTLLIGVFSFGNSLIFDRAILVVFVFCLLLNRCNINNVGVILAVIMGRLVSEVIGLALPYLDNSYVRFVLYAVTGYGFWWFRSDYKNNLMMSIMYVASVFAEIFWWFNGQEALLLIGFVLLTLNALFVRWMLFMRFTYTEKWFPKKVQLNLLEWQTYTLFQWVIYLQLAVIAEYLISHIFNLSIAYLYGVYPYLSHILSIYLVWLFLCSSARKSEKNILNA